MCGRTAVHVHPALYTPGLQLRPRSDHPLLHVPLVAQHRVEPARDDARCPTGRRAAAAMVLTRRDHNALGTVTHYRTREGAATHRLVLLPPVARTTPPPVWARRRRASVVAVAVVATGAAAAAAAGAGAGW